MFDFVSTRSEVDSDTQACARVLMAAIAQATRDLAQAPTKDEQKLEENRLRDVVSSLEFFFGKNQPIFRLYCDMIGMGADTYLEHLQTGRPANVAHPLYTEQDFRAFRVRIKWWREQMARQEAVLA